MIRMKIKSSTLAVTTLLSALVVVLDYTMKYSNLKIPFPMLPFLKFDFTGIPIVLSCLLVGFAPGVLASAVATAAILARSGDVIGSSMKGLAEFVTILGIAIGLKLRLNMSIVFVLGISFRVVVMTGANLLLIQGGIMAMPQSYADIPVVFGLLLGVFNAIQGGISVLGGFVVFQALRRRAPSLVKKPL